MVKLLHILNADQIKYWNTPKKDIEKLVGKYWSLNKSPNEILFTFNKL